MRVERQPSESVEDVELGVAFRAIPALLARDTLRHAVHDDPVILTLGFDAESEARFEAARERWFPPRLNIVPAHLTLFHRLPGGELEDVRGLTAAAAAETPPFGARVTTVVPLGGGWALRVASEQIDALRARLATGFAPWLTRQDAQGFRAHVTIQNKVGRATAKACGEAIRAEFSPWEAGVTSVRLWAYRGGPWEALDEVPLGGGTATADRPA